MIANVAWLVDVGRSLRAELLHVLGDALAPRPRLRALRRRPGVRQPRVHAATTGRPPAGRGRPRVGLRDGLLLVLVCGDRHGEVALRQGCRLPLRDGLHVRVDQPGGGARHRTRSCSWAGSSPAASSSGGHHDRVAGGPRRPLAAGAAVERRAANASPRAADRGTRARPAGEHRTPTRAVGTAAAFEGRLGRLGDVHDGGPHDAPPRAVHRLPGGRVPRDPRPGGLLERRLRPRPRLLDQRGERRSSGRSSPSSASSARSATCPSPRRSGTAGSPSGASWPSSSPT